MDTARIFPTYGMIAMIVGYIIGIIAMAEYISQGKSPCFAVLP